jgi:hypothetical protein
MSVALLGGVGRHKAGGPECANGGSLCRGRGYAASGSASADSALRFGRKGGAPGGGGYMGQGKGGAGGGGGYMGQGKGGHTEACSLARRLITLMQPMRWCCATVHAAGLLLQHTIGSLVQTPGGGTGGGVVCR